MFANEGVLDFDHHDVIESNYIRSVGIPFRVVDNTSLYTQKKTSYF